MKPRNFPGRKNERRHKVLARLKHIKNTKAERLGRPPRRNVDYEVDILIERIMRPETARGIRTKIWRGDRGRLRT